MRQHSIMGAHLAGMVLLVIGGFVIGFNAPHAAKVAEPPQIEFVDRPVEVEVPYQVEHRVEVPGPVQYVDRPYTVERIINHYTVKRIAAKAPECPSIADALNHYEALR